jgi:hypothetical protein
MDPPPLATGRFRRRSGGGGVLRFRPGVKLAKHFVYGVDDCLRPVQLNLVT